MRYAAVLMWMFLVVAAGCGGDGVSGTDAAADCNGYAAQLAAVVKANASCTVDADCHWINDGCLQMCAAFINSNGASQAADIVHAAEAAHCNDGCECLALAPACNAGVCGAKRP